MGTGERKPLILFGAGDHARVVADLVRGDPSWELRAAVDSRPGAPESFEGVPVLPEISLGLGTGVEPEWVFIAIGDNYRRCEVASRISARYPRARFATLVHPSAIVSPRARLGAGTLCLAGSIVNTGASLGDHVLVHSGAIVDHDCRLDDGASLGARAVLGGRVTIGRCTAIGLGAAVLQGLTIGAHTVVGAQALLTRPVPDRQVVYGVPGRPIRGRDEGETYL